MNSEGPTRRGMLTMTGTALIGGYAATGFNRASAQSRLSWRDGPPLPGVRQEIYPCLHKGRLHVAGGFTALPGGLTGPTNAHNILSPGEAGWTDGTPLPMPRHHPQLVSYRGYLLCLGGFESSDEAAWQMRDSVWVWLEDEERWTDITPMPAPSAEGVCGVIGSGLHLCSGRVPKGEANGNWEDHVDTNAHWRFDGTQWMEAAPAPTARNSAAAGVIDGRLHVVGGRMVHGGNTAIHEAYDPGTDRWERLSPMPKAQGGLAAAVIGENLYTFGGEYFGRNTRGVYAEAWVYDALSDRWKALPNMPRPRHGLGAVAMDGEIYVIAGAMDAGASRASEAVEIFRP